MLSVKEIQKSDVPDLVNYWINSDPDFLKSLGVDLNLLPSAPNLTDALSRQIETPIVEKKSYCIIWQLNGQSIGHSNLNPVVFGEIAAMHLHIWNAANRGHGYASEFMKLTLPYYFDLFQLKTLYAEPYALNPAPHKVLERAGFQKVKEYITTPGSINFEQPVKRWELPLSLFDKHYRNANG